MRVGAAVLLGLTLAACGADTGAAQQSPSRVTVTDLRGTPIPSFAGQLVIGSGIGVFGMVPRAPRDPTTGIMVVEMLTSQTTSQLRRGDAKIDVMSFVYDVDCTTMRYRLAYQVSYERNGQPVHRTNLDNAMIEGPMAPYLQSACGLDVPEGLQSGAEFSSMEAFLATADPILELRRASLPQQTLTITPPQR